jgi:hypothetical protein
MSDFEVVKSDVDGWDVRRAGEEQALTNHATREEAEAAAKIEEGLEDDMGSGSGPVDVRQGPFSSGKDGDDLDQKRVALTFGTMMIAVILLIIVIAVIVAVTRIGS